MLSAKGVAYGLEAYELGIKNADLFKVLNDYVNDPCEYTLFNLLARLDVRTRAVPATKETITAETLNNLGHLREHKNYDHVYWTLMGLLPGARDLIYNLKQAVENNTLDDFILDSLDTDHIKHYLLDIKTNDNALAYFKLLHRYKIVDPDFISPLIKAVELNPNVNWKDAISKFQLGSKNWMTKELSNLDLGTVAIMGGWVGTQAKMLLDNKPTIKSITSFDLDTEANVAALTVNSHYPKFTVEAADIYEVDYLARGFDTVINPICEHIPDFDKWYSKIPAGTLVVLQNNNMVEAPDHINCVHSLEEFSKQVALSTKLYEGEYSFMNWTRYMLIGYK